MKTPEKLALEIIAAHPEAFDEGDAAFVRENGIRRCDECGAFLMEGFYLETEGLYLCSEECMEKAGISQEEYEELYENDVAYWTEWETSDLADRLNQFI